MISLLMKLGLTQKIAKLVAYIAIPLLILFAFYLALDAYGDSRFREGRAAEEAAWMRAQDELLRKSAASADEADRQALARQLDFAAEVQEEKEKVDEAIANGSSPFDVLFPAGGVSAGEDRRAPADAR